MGPKVFNFYCSDLVNLFGDDTELVTYADDSYVVVTENDDARPKQPWKTTLDG